MNGTCMNCVEEWRRGRDEAALLPIGEERPADVRRECERPDCALYDAILDRMSTASGVCDTFVPLLRSMRASMARGPRRGRDWQAQQELLEESRQRMVETPTVTDSWDHSIPPEVRRVIGDFVFDPERIAWVRLQQAFVAAKAAHVAVVVMAGPSKIGKTVAAARWLASKKAGRFITAARVAALSDSKALGDRQELDALRGSDGLVIDDLGRSDGGEKELGRVTELARAREAKNLPTVITALSARDLPPSLVKRARITTVY